LSLYQDGSVWGWGYNKDSQLGNASSKDAYTAVKVFVLDNVTSLSSAPDHALATRSDGTVWGWGSNWDGVLGDGTETPRTVPVQALLP
jgi:hypothetical protein